MDLSQFDYTLPADRIAQFPAQQRDESRLLLVNRRNESLAEGIFHDLPRYLSPGTLLVLNDTYVMPARLLGKKEGRGAAIEMLLLEPKSETDWEVLAYRASRLKVGTKIIFSDSFSGEVTQVFEGGKFQVRFAWQGSWQEALSAHGHIPLPPYIERADGQFEARDRDRYQTVYARSRTDYNSAAAPTAGLHFTPELLERLRQQEIEVRAVTLRVGLDTFLPMRVERVEDHHMHSESYWIPEETAAAVASARSQGRIVTAVGTTVARVLESAALPDGRVRPGGGRTDLFIFPGYQFRTVNAMITNFHLPRSTLLLLVSAFMGNELRKRAYDYAIAHQFRFYSYGDAMLIE